MALRLWEHPSPGLPAPAIKDTALKHSNIYSKKHIYTYSSSYVCLKGQNLKEFFDINNKCASEALFKKKKERKNPNQPIMCIGDSSLEL